MSERSADEPLPPDAATALTSAWGRGIFSTGAALLGAALVYFAFTADVRDPVHLPLGLLILFLAGLPSLLWARAGRPSLPIFEVLLLTTANAYAFPLLNGHQELIFYIPGDITTAALAVVTYQLTAIAAYLGTSGRASTHPFWREEVVTGEMGRWMTYGMALNTAYILASTFTEIIPASLESILRAVFFGIGIVSTFITSRRLGAGELTRGERLFFAANLALQCSGLIVTLFLVGAVSVLLLALVGYVSSRGRIPLVVCTLVLLTVAVLHHGKPEMRARYWQDGRYVPTLAEVPGFFREWLGHGLTFEEEGETRRMTSRLIERTSLFHIMCLVVSTTPHQQPFLDGETYRHIPAQFVPRLLWPDKPLGHVSTSRLSVYYGLQREEDTATTTIAFGMITEAFANFGFYGVAVIGALVAFCLKKAQCWGRDSPLFSYGGIVLVLLLAWSFQVEFTLSIWLASFYQACIAVLAAPVLLKRILG